MSIETNKQLVRDAYAAISAGNLDGFMDRLTDDVTWTFFGSHRFAKTFNGKDDITQNLFDVLGAQLESGIVVNVKNLIAEGNQFVVEALGEARAKDGRD